MKKTIFYSLGLVLLIAATAQSTEVDRSHSHEDNLTMHKTHKEAPVAGKGMHHTTTTLNHNKLVQKEIADYAKLLGSVQHDQSPLGTMLTAHYKERLAHLEKLLTSPNTEKPIDEQLYQLHQKDSLFSRYY